MNDNIILTEHVIERTMERANLNRKRAERIVKLAIERGKDISTAQKAIRGYLAQKQRGEQVAKEYNGYCYIIEQKGSYQVGITMYPIPKNICCGMRHDGKTKIRNAKKYSKFYS